VENRAKYTAALMIAVIAIGAFLILPPAMAEEEPNGPDKPRWSGQRPLPRLRLWGYILGNGTPTTIQGELVVLEGHILVVEIDGTPVNVNIPGKWLVDGETMTAQELFDGETFIFGDTATISAMKLERTEETHTVTVFFAYTIEADGATAYALLPFNIETQ